MNLVNINNTINKIAEEWEQFKQLNNKKEKEIKKIGAADPMTIEQLQKINNSIDETKASLENIETMVARPGFTEIPNFAYKSNETKYSKAFNSYLRKGIENEITSFEKKELSIGDIGYSITYEMSSTMQKMMEDVSQMFKICNIFDISTDSLELIGEGSGIKAGWIYEFDSNSVASDPVQMRKKSIIAHTIYAQPEISQNIIDDQRIDIENYITAKLSDIFASKANNAFINGDGKGKPFGILSYPGGVGYGKVEQINSGINGGYNIDSLLKIFFSINERYAQNASFLMSRSALQAIRMLKDKNERYIWQPSMTFGMPDTLFGAPIYQSSDMPQLQDKSLSIAFGDFRRFYTIVKKGDVKILRDNLTSKPHVKFFARTAIGGDIDDFAAVKLLKASA